jgi:hypothetical protein
MASGMVLLFTLLLVSDWFKLVEAFVTVTNTSMCWFFILFYILGVLIILNIVVRLPCCCMHCCTLLPHYTVCYTPLMHTPMMLQIYFSISL